jgi:thiamine-phosphate pyrophosphorylase
LDEERTVSEHSAKVPGGPDGGDEARARRDLHRGLRGFYAVLDRDDEALAELLVSPYGAHARVLQVRLKPATTRQIVDVARRARVIAHRHGALLCVNDRVDVALAVAADIVHLGQDDLPLAAARALVGDRMWIGVSTHDDEQVRAAVAGGADYLGFGPVFATATKENPDPVQGVAGLARATAIAGAVPVVAIGGITPDRAAEVAAAGAWSACAIGSVNGAADPAAAGRAIGYAWATDVTPGAPQNPR